MSANETLLIKPYRAMNCVEIRIELTHLAKHPAWMEFQWRVLMDQ